MTSIFWMGVSFGVVITFILHLIAIQSYKRILVMKAEDQTSEYINGKFYKIVKE